MNKITFNRRFFIKSILIFFFNKLTFSKNINSIPDKLTIIFGSCSNQNKEMKHWKEIITYKPNYIFLLGDNVYGDFFDKNAKKLKEAYDKLLLNKYFQIIKEKIPIVSIWDDHDYGINDGGKNWIYKEKAKELFLNFYDIAPGDIRRKREGIYKSWNLFIKEKKIKVIALDVRYFKDNFKRNYSTEIKKKYIEDNSANKTILGPKQWIWLKKQLDDDFDLVILLSSFQVLSKSHGWEKWNNFPIERDRLINLLNKKKVPKLILSGDRHSGAIYKHDKANIYEVTASSFNQKELSYKELDPLRVGKFINQNNFGLLEITSNSISVSIISGTNINKKEYSKLKLYFI